MNKYILNNFFEFVKDGEFQKIDIIINSNIKLSNREIDLIDLHIYKNVSKNNIKFSMISDYLEDISSTIKEITKIDVVLDIA